MPKTVDEMWQCPKCNKPLKSMFDVETGYTENLSTFWADSKWQCPECDQKFSITCEYDLVPTVQTRKEI